jgi:competence protein ComEA
VRALLAVQPDEPAARTPAGSDTPPPAWLPGADFDRHVARHVSASGWRSRLRWDPGRRGAAARGVLLIAAVAATGWWLAGSRPREVPISGPAVAPAPSVPSVASPSTLPSVSAVSAPVASPSSVEAAPASSAASIVVDVAGKVRRPGIYQLPPGSRVDDAVRAAGGPRSGVSTVSLNLAEPLRDGEQIVVGRAGTAAPLGGGVGGTAPDGATSSAATIVDLNTATLEQLETLPGVGPVLGQHILDWRDAHGQFTSVSQLQEVSGIGDVRLAQLSPLVTV